MDAIVTFINWLDDFIWGIPMIVLLLGTHLFMTAAPASSSASCSPASGCPSPRIRIPPAT